MSGWKGILTCDMCLELKEVTHFGDLYISGSEGTYLCSKCENRVLNFIRQQARIALLKRKEDHIRRQNGK